MLTPLAPGTDKSECSDLSQECTGTEGGGKGEREANDASSPSQEDSPPSPLQEKSGGPRG